MATSDSPLSVPNVTLAVARSASASSGGNAALGFSISGNTLSITTDGAHSFGVKPVADKPRFVWLADDGLAPNATLGRATAWGSGTTNLENGTISTAQVAQGQAQSVAFDHNNTGAALSENQVGAQRKKMVFRRRYEDFKVTTATITRTRITKPILSGTLPSPGDTVTGQTSAATGIVQSVVDDGTTRWVIFYEPTGGTINDPTPTDFIYDETMMWASGSAKNAEGSAEFPTGTFRTFNNKVIRFWPLNRNTSFPNVYCADGKPNYHSKPQITAEGAGGTSGAITNSTYNQEDFAFQWNTEVFLFTEASAVDVADGAMFWKKNGTVIADGQVLFSTRSTTHPAQQETVYHAEVSNGAQPGSTNYWDYIYVDDSHYFIQIRDSVSGQFIVLPIKSWADRSINAEYLNFANWTHIDIYKDGALEGSVAR